MDLTEDLTARDLIRHILNTEPPRTPFTRSISRYLNSSWSQRTRAGSRDSSAHTPQNILRRSLKQKMRESLSRKSVPSTQKRTPSAVPTRATTPAVVSSMLDKEDTPRHLLMNILQTEVQRSPAVHQGAALEESRLPPADSSEASRRPSLELSGLELPDVTLGRVASGARGLSRKRPCRSLNVTAFEKKLKEGNGEENEDEISADDHSSLYMSSSTSLSLKTPFEDVRTEKKGLRRRVSGRRKITEEEFSAAVNQRRTGDAEGPSGVGPADASQFDGFTLGLGKFSELEVTHDIIRSSAGLLASSGERDANAAMESQPPGDTDQAVETEEGISPFGEEETEMVAPGDSQEEDAAKDDQDQTSMGSQAEEDGAKTEIEDHIEPQAEEGAADTQSEEDAVDKTRSEEEEDATSTQDDEDEEASEYPTDPTSDPGSEKDDDVGDSQTGEETEGKQTEEEEEEEEEEDGEKVVETEEEDDGEKVMETDEEEDGEKVETEGEDDGEKVVETEEEDDGEKVVETEEDVEEEEGGPPLEAHMDQVLRRSHRPEGGTAVGVTEERCSDAGWSDGAQREDSINIHLEMEDDESGGTLDSAEAPRRLREAAAPDHDLQEEDWDDQEEEEEEEEGEDTDNSPVEIPMKTPAFVREKIQFFLVDPVASPSTFKNPLTTKPPADVPAAKPKPARRRRAGSVRQQGVLPKHYMMSVFRHFAKTRVSVEVYPVLQEVMDRFLDRLAYDLETYADHAGRKTIEVEDAKLLLRRQGHVSDKVPLEVLIEKYLRMDQRKLLIPIATSGNVVVPKARR